MGLVRGVVALLCAASAAGAGDKVTKSDVPASAVGVVEKAKEQQSAEASRATDMVADLEKKAKQKAEDEKKTLDALQNLVKGIKKTESVQGLFTGTADELAAKKEVDEQFHKLIQEDALGDEELNVHLEQSRKRGADFVTLMLSAAGAMGLGGLCLVLSSFMPKDEDSETADGAGLYEMVESGNTALPPDSDDDDEGYVEGAFEGALEGVDAADDRAMGSGAMDNGGIRNLELLESDEVEHQE